MDTPGALLHAQGYWWILATVLPLLLLGELWRPLAAAGSGLRQRWTTNLALFLLGLLLVRLLPLGGVAAALLAEQRQWGLLSQLALPAWVQIGLSALLLDLWHYGYHRLAHWETRILWPLHRVHHTDDRIDITTAWRFHPLESLLQSGLLIVVVVGLGAAPLGVALLLLANQATGFFTHANLRLPKGLEATLRWLFVTPPLHRVHHRCETRYSLRNFGVVLSLWDRCFHSYQPPLPECDAHYGVDGFDLAAQRGLLNSLRNPLQSPQRPTAKAAMLSPGNPRAQS